jgi:hypothetical protein
LDSIDDPSTLNDRGDNAYDRGFGTLWCSLDVTDAAGCNDGGSFFESISATLRFGNSLLNKFAKLNPTTPPPTIVTSKKSISSVLGTDDDDADADAENDDEEKQWLRWRRTPPTLCSPRIIIVYICLEYNVAVVVKYGYCCID